MTDPRPLTQRLKEDNWDLHQQAEHDTLPQHMVRGTITKEVYLRLLEQSYLINTALDAALKNAVEQKPELAKLIGDDQFHGPWYAEDLRHFGLTPGAATPGAGARMVLDDIQNATGNPLRVLGLHYVRQGATNGNRFVAKRVRPTLGLPQEDRGAGAVHMDPYGAAQRAQWEAFKVELDALDLTEDEKATVASAGRDMFRHMIALHRDLMPEVTVTAGQNTATHAG